MGFVMLTEWNLMAATHRCWLIISWRMKTYPSYIADYLRLVHNPIEGSHSKPSRIQWNERGVLCGVLGVMIDGDTSEIDTVKQVVPLET